VKRVPARPDEEFNSTFAALGAHPTGPWWRSLSADVELMIKPARYERDSCRFRLVQRITSL
jgi:hypothetical protein